MGKDSMVKAEGNPSGKKAEQIASMLEILADADKPVPFEEMCEEAGAKYPQDVIAAMHALELVGAVERFNYVESGSTRRHLAYRLTEDVEVKS